MAGDLYSFDNTDFKGSWIKDFFSLIDSDNVAIYRPDLSTTIARFENSVYFSMSVQDIYQFETNKIHVIFNINAEA